MNNDYIQHWGINGQKWGVRRYQNEDGTLTEEGRLRYRVGKKAIVKRINELDKQAGKAKKKNDRKEIININKERARVSNLLKDPKTVNSIGSSVIANRTVSSLAGFVSLGIAAFTAGAPLAGMLGASIGAVSEYAMLRTELYPKNKK